MSFWRHNDIIASCVRWEVTRKWSEGAVGFGAFNSLTLSLSWGTHTITVKTWEEEEAQRRNGPDATTVFFTIKECLKTKAVVVLRGELKGKVEKEVVAKEQKVVLRKKRKEAPLWK